MKQILKNDRKHEGNQQALFLRTVLTGLVGGMLAYGMSVFMHYFSFSEISPKTYVIKLLGTNEWINSWIGDMIALCLTGILSILMASLYYLLFRKILSLMLSLFYGFVLWLLTIGFIHPLFPNTKNLFELDGNTIVSTLCHFLLYGIFIGYSISYDYYASIVIKQKSTH